MKKVFSDFCLLLKIISFSLIFQMTLYNTYAQQPFSVFVFPGGVKQYTYFSTVDSTVHTDYSNDGSYNIGREGGSQHPFGIWRSYGTITSLGLPRDAKIDNATFSISFNQSKPGYSIKIVRLSSDPSGNLPETNWASIGSGTEWVSAVTTANIQTPSISDLVSKLQALIDNSTPIYMGFKCNQEGTDGTLNSFTITVEGTYHREGSPFFVKNSFNGGKIKVDNNEVWSGTKFSWFDLDRHDLEAIEQYYDTTGYNYVWNTSGVPASISKWQEQLTGNPLPPPQDLSGSKTYRYTSLKIHSGATIIAGLKRVCNIYRNDLTEFHGNISAGTIASIVEQNSGQISAPATKSVGGITYYFAGWTDDKNAPNPRTITPTVNQTFTALYKTIHKSNNVNAFTNSSQRKLVKTKDNWMHQTYESMGRVWLEHSTNNGTTWFLGNGGKPLDNGAGKCPSIDWHYNTQDPNNQNYYAVVVAYQQKYSSTSYTIEYETFKYTNGSYVRQIKSQSTAGPLFTEPVGGDQYSSTNANPNIAWGRLNSFALTFERKSTIGSMQPGIYVIYGTMYETGIEPIGALPSPPLRITGTSASSTNPSVFLNKSIIDDSFFNVVYQTASTLPGPANIVNVGLWSYPNGSIWQVNQSSSQVISYATGVMNTKPSIVQMPDNYIRVSWIRNWYGSSTLSTLVNAVYWNSVSPSVYNYSGVYVNSVSLNIRDGNTNTYYAYAQYTNNTTWQNFASNGSSTITLNTTGQHIQLSNGSSSSNMYASAFYPAALPYYFQSSNSIGGLSKSTGEEDEFIGRGIVVARGNSGFSYSVKSLKVNGNTIKFIEIPESKDTTDSKNKMQPLMLDSLNKFLVSEPFSIQEGSIISFSEAAGFIATDGISQLSAEESKKDYMVDCKIELIEDGTNKPIGVVKQVRFSPEDVNESNLKMSNLRITDKNTKTARLKITLTGNLKDIQGMLVNEYNTVNDNILSKLAAEELTLKEEGIITTYEMEQNYPNPFNPSTRIKYQIPQDGLVTLKIYDILGEEVKTLVNEMKSTGRYEIEFNASDLASGTYIYQIRVNDFVSAKKMLLIK